MATEEQTMPPAEEQPAAAAAPPPQPPAAAGAAAAGGSLTAAHDAEHHLDHAAGGTGAGGAGAPRLMITQLVLENFKSYAGRKVIGPFHKCFSSIVGPNGSGKSNVIDSMLFVFGTRSNKLRMKKASELIHRSAEHPDCEHAKVTVHFEDIVDLAADELEAAGVAPTTDNNDFRRVAGSAFQVGGRWRERREARDERSE